MAPLALLDKSKDLKSKSSCTNGAGYGFEYHGGIPWLNEQTTNLGAYQLLLTTRMLVYRERRVKISKFDIHGRSNIINVSYVCFLAFAVVRLHLSNTLRVVADRSSRSHPTTFKPLVLLRRKGQNAPIRNCMADGASIFSLATNIARKTSVYVNLNVVGRRSALWTVLLRLGPQALHRSPPHGTILIYIGFPSRSRVPGPTYRHRGELQVGHSRAAMQAIPSWHGRIRVRVRGRAARSHSPSVSLTRRRRVVMKAMMALQPRKSHSVLRLCTPAYKKHLWLP
jgi:hypothetical protein